MATEDRRPVDGDCDVLAVTPVLVEDRSHFRYMALGNAALTVKRLERAVKDAWNYNHHHARVTKRDEKRIRGELDDLRRSLELLDQVGWREPS